MERSSISLSYYPCLSELLTLPVFRGSRLLPVFLLAFRHAGILQVALCRRADGHHLLLHS